MGKPKISVITATYNCANTIEKTLLSVFNQSYSKLEYIIIDGGSCDDTLVIVNKYRGQLAVVVSEPDKGIYDAMNKGIDLATGDFIYFIGGDDTLIDGVLNKIAPMINNPDSVYYGDVIMTPSGVRYNGEFNRLKILRCNISHQAIFFPKSTFIGGRRYNIDYKLWADYLLNLDLYAQKFKFTYLREDIAMFNTEGASRNGDFMFIRNQNQIIRQRFSKAEYLYFILLHKPFAAFKSTIKKIIPR